MLKRDFTKSNKEYFAKNKITLISVALFLVVGILITIIAWSVFVFKKGKNNKNEHNNEMLEEA